MTNFIETDVIEPLVKDVVDPILATLERAAVSGIEDLVAMAEKALGLYKSPAAGATAGQASGGALSALAAGAQVAIDAIITEGVGEIPVAGALIAPEIVHLANSALDDLESKGVALVQSLLGQARTKLQSFLPPPAA